MQEILSSIEQQKLIKQSWLRDLVTNDYLSDETNENLILISDLMFNDDIDRAKQFNVWSNLFMSINDVYRFFIWNPILDIELELNRYITDLNSIWKTVMWIGIKDNKLVTEYIPAKNYVYGNWEHKVYRYYEAIIEDKKEYFLLKQRYLVWEIINELYKISWMASTQWDKVDLTTIIQTSWLQESIKTWLDVESIIVLEDDSVLEDENQSMMDKIKNLVYSLDRKQVMFETQFLQEVEQYKIFENIELSNAPTNSDGSTNLKSLWKVFTNNPDIWSNGDIKYINNSNPLIKDAIDYEEKQLKKVSSAVFVPLDFLWIQTTGSTSWSSRQIMVNSFIKSVEAKRKLLETRLIKPLLDLLIQNKQKTENWEEVTTNIIWNDVISQVGLDVANELKIAREAWIISQYSAIKLYLWLTNDKEVDEELAKMSNEDIITNDTNNEPSNRG